MELVCPAGSLNAFKAAVENGADAIYLGFKDETNARFFAGLNFNDKAAQKALTLARDKGVKLFVAINIFANQDQWQKWQSKLFKGIVFCQGTLFEDRSPFLTLLYSSHHYECVLIEMNA